MRGLQFWTGCLVGATLAALIGCWVLPLPAFPSVMLGLLARAVGTLEVGTWGLTGIVLIQDAHGPRQFTQQAWTAYTAVMHACRLWPALHPPSLRRLLLPEGPRASQQVLSRGA